MNLRATAKQEAEHEVIVYCNANPEINVIQAIEIVFKSMRKRMGIKVQQEIKKYRRDRIFLAAAGPACFVHHK